MRLPSRAAQEQLCVAFLFAACPLLGCDAKPAPTNQGSAVRRRPTMPEDPSFRKLLLAAIASQAGQYPPSATISDEFHLLACADRLKLEGSTKEEMRELLGDPEAIITAVWRYDWNDTGAYSTISFRGTTVCSFVDRGQLDVPPQERMLVDRIKRSMTQRQVRQILGPPTHGDLSEKWNYSYIQGRDFLAEAYVRFEDGKAVEIRSGWSHVDIY